MNYELCKQLKDAGFPQKSEFYWDRDNNFSECLDEEYDEVYGKVRSKSAFMLDNKGVPTGKNLYAIPTLSELIEACKGHTFHMIIASNGYCTLLDHEGQLIHQCPSPEKAVIKFWLELNKK